DAARAYASALDKVTRWIGDKKLGVTIEPPIDRIVLVDRTGMCDSRMYKEPFTPPTPCATEPPIENPAAQSPSTVLVLDDPAVLEGAMDEAVAASAGLFQSYSTPDLTPPSASVETAVQDALQAFINARKQKPGSAGDVPKKPEQKPDKRKKTP